MKEILLNFVNTHKYKIIVIGLLILSLLVNVFSIKSCVNFSTLNKHNIEALTDSIHYYKSKTGEIIASKKILEGDLSTLKLANDSLYYVIKDMKVKDPSSVVYIKTVVDNLPQDTIWNTDTIIPNIYIQKSFAFNNDYRTLEGIVSVNDSTLALNIQEDKTYVDYILAVEDNTVKLKSNNPYVKFNEVQGITIPKQKHGNWGFTIGPAIFTGVNTSGKFTAGAGVSCTWGYRIK